MQAAHIGNTGLYISLSTSWKDLYLVVDYATRAFGQALFLIG